MQMLQTAAAGLFVSSLNLIIFTVMDEIAATF